MARVRWTPQSINDTDQIAEYIAKDSRVYASIQTERFFKAVKVLESQIRAIINHSETQSTQQCRTEE